MTEKAQDSINIIHKFGIANLNAKKPLTVNNKYNRTPISSKFFRFPESSLRDNITKHMKEYSMTLDTLLSVKAEQFTKYNPKKKDVIKARVDYFRLQVLEMKESESEESKQSPSDPLPNHSPNMSSSISQASSMSPSNPLSNHPPTMSPSISKKLDEIQELIKSQTYVIGNKYYDDKVAKVKKYYDDKLVKWESEHTKELTNLQNQLLKSREANSTKTQIIKNHKRSIANLKQQKSDNHIITPRVSNKRNDARHRNSIRKHIGAEQEIELCDELRNDNRNLDEHLKESYRPEFEKETNQKICSESRDAVKNIPAMVAHHAGYEGYGMYDKKRILRMYKRDPFTKELSLHTLEGTKIIKEKSATSKALHKSRVHFINQPEHTFLKMEPIEDDPIATNRGATRHVSYPDYIKGILLFYTNEPFSIHSDICPLHAIIQTASHEIGDLAQEANDSWNLVRKEIIYEYWLQHKDLHIVIGKQLKNDIESNEVVALHIPGNESKYALRETQHWLASLDPHLTEPHQKMKVGVRLVKSIMIREIMYNALKDTFKRGYDCWAINYVIKLCFKMGWIIQLFDPNSGYPYIWWIVFCLGSALKEHVQESPLNRGLAEALLQSHERLNCEFKLKCKRNNNHTIAGLVFIMESLGIKRIGGQELNYFLDTNVSGQAKFKLLSDDLHRTYVEFDETVATLSLDLQRIVNTLRRMKTGDPIPPALKPFVEDVELDAQIQQLERIKQKRIKREQRMLAKKLKNVIALDGDGIDEEKIKGVMDGFLLEQLRKEANKENALPVVYKQRNDRSKRRRMNTSNDNL
eukprot:476633_1